MFSMFFSKFTPDHIKNNPYLYAQAKNILGSAIIAIVAIPFYALIYYILHHYVGAVVILFEGLIIAGAVLVLRYTGSIFWAREIIIGSLALCLLWLSYSMGGIYSPVSFWLILPPVAAFFFGGNKTGIFSGIVCIAVVIFMYGMEYFHLPIPVSPITSRLLLQLFSIIGLGIIILTLAYFFEKRAEELVHEIQLANEQMRLANQSEVYLKNELVKSISQLEDQKLELENTNRFLKETLDEQKRVSQKLAERTQSLRIQKMETEIERLSKNLLQNILESSIEYSIIATNLDGLIIVWNEGAQRNYGYLAEEMVEKQNIRIIHTHEDVLTGASKKFFDTVLQNGKAEGIWERVRKNGSHFLASVVATLRRDSEGIPVGFVMISKDITNQKRLEDQLIKTNQELEQFAYIASHDLKAPLRAIDRIASWIEEDMVDKLDDKTKENLNLLRQRVTRMSNLISGILQYSRMGRTDFQIHSVDTKQLLQSIIDNLNISQNFNIHYADDMPTLQTDDIQLGQVFSNLIDNSIKYHHHKKGNIEIGVKDLVNYYEFFVKDDGPGIAPAYHEKIFQIFQTLHSKDEFESTGIGLSIVKKIVEAQGGRVSVESEEGKGATFYFSWPKYPYQKVSE